MRKCTLPALEEIMKTVKIETTDRPCPEHGRHQVRNYKVID
jgi:ssDNA-binding Zn-finger/Zn-ribbon topoisomerase 1